MALMAVCLNSSERPPWYWPKSSRRRAARSTSSWFLPRQFENEANARTHERTTGMEIVESFADDPLEYFVSGLGTGGTIAGVAAALRKHSPATRIIATEPDNSPLLGSEIAQKYEDDGSPVAASHPSFRPHPMQGWSPDFIPLVTTTAVERGLIDEIVPVSGAEAIEWSRQLAREEGIFCGITSGATFARARRIAELAAEGSKVLAILPDTGERYMTTPLFADIAEEMNAGEEAISHSTPLCRFDMAPGLAPAAPPPIPVDVAPAAVEHVEGFIADRNRPLLMFSLQWCEFCWSARKLFDAMGVKYSLVELDGEPYRDLAWAGEVRRALATRTGSPTVPQIFIGGQRLGGVTDLFDAYNGDALAGMLAEADIAASECGIADAYALLPAWMHPR